MKTTIETLRQFVARVGQSEAAHRLGVTQGAVWQALNSTRDIHVMHRGEGRVEAIEIKPFPARVGS